MLCTHPNASIALVQRPHSRACPWLAHKHWRQTAPGLGCNDLILLDREKTWPAKFPIWLLKCHGSCLQHNRENLIYFRAHMVLWNIPKQWEVWIIYKTILPRNQRPSSVAQATVVELCTVHLANTSACYFVGSSQCLIEVVSSSILYHRRHWDT